MASLMYHEIPIRLLGYGFCMGEAMKYNFSLHSVDISNFVGFGFVIAHVVHSMIDNSGDTGKMLLAGVESLCWEGLASCLIPTVTTYYVCKFTAEQLHSYKKTPEVVKTWGAFVVGCLLVPAYFYIVDPAVDSLIAAVFAK